MHVRAIHRARVYDNYVVTFPAVAIFQFNPSTYTVAEDVAGGEQAVSLQLISGTLSTNIGLQVAVTGGSQKSNPVCSELQKTAGVSVQMEEEIHSSGCI